MKTRSGFTILELLMVITVIGILAVAFIPNVINAKRRSYDTGAQLYAKNMNQWITSWLANDQTRSTTDLDTSCTNAIYVSEGAPNQLPLYITSCTVLIEPNGVGTFGTTVVSITGAVYTRYQ
jgi:prepilin-type N-terminal cleavage/methylation domain-containing protein